MPHDIFGMTGVILILLAYGLLQSERARHDDFSFLLLNTAGAALILVSLIYAFNLSAFVLEAIWLSISLYGITRRIARGPLDRRRP